MKNVQTLLLFPWRLLFTLPLPACMKKNFHTKEEIPLHIRVLKLVYSEEKIASVNTNIRSGKSKNAYQIDCRQL